MEEPQTGDHWTYEFRDDITGEVKATITNTDTDVSGTDINVRLTLLGNGNPGYLNFDRSWNLAAALARLTRSGRLSARRPRLVRNAGRRANHRYLSLHRLAPAANSRPWL
jgi:hypothetical protein